MTYAQLIQSIDAALAAQQSGTTTLEPGITLRCYPYNGPKGFGFVATASINRGGGRVTITKQTGPETYRERVPSGSDVAIYLGHAVGEITYDISPGAQLQWTQALTALDNAAALNAFDPATTPVQSVLGPVLNIAGNPVPSMTVMEFRGVMAQLALRIGQIRAGNL